MASGQQPLVALARALIPVVIVSAMLLAFVGAAFGHAVVVESSPRDGAVLENAPEHVAVRFNEPVSLIAARLLDAAGRDVLEGNATSVIDRELRIALPPAPADGTYVASYRVVSLDGHAIGGTVVFSIGTPTTRPLLPDVPPVDWGWRLASAAARLALDIGILGGAGAALFLWTVAPGRTAPRQTMRIARRLSVIGCAAAILSIGIQGGLLAGGPPETLASLAAWRTGLSSTFGRTALAALLGLSLIAVVRPLALVGAAIALASFALSGHVVTAGPKWLTIPALLAHVAAVAFWAGSLLPLRAAIRADAAASVPIVRRFSHIALAAVGLLVVAGTLIAVLQVASFAALFTTIYGLLLLAKLVLVAGLLAMATVNKLRLTPALARGDAYAKRALLASIGIEIALVVAILIATVALGTTPPPRALASGGDHSVHEHHARVLTLELSASGHRATIAFQSDESGPNAVSIEFADGGRIALAAKEVVLVLSNPDAGIEAMKRLALPVEPGHWRVADLMLVPAGRWTVRLEALIDDFEKPIFEGAIHLR